MADSTAALPTGTVTFLMTDIEGSTRLLRALGSRYADVLAAHHALVRAAVAAAGGTEVSTEGDAFFCVFGTARAAVQAAAQTQRALAAHPWPDGQDVRVRIGVHTGEAVLGPDGYLGIDVHRVARVAAAGHGGQVVLTGPTRALVEGVLPPGVGIVFLGSHRLKDLEAPELLYQLVLEGLPFRFPPLRSLEAPAYDLPTTASAFVGRETETAEIARLLEGHRLVTLTGPGGVGKTRLSVRVAADVSANYPGGVAFVPLAQVCDAALVPDEVARALALPVGSYAGPSGLRRLADQLAGRRMLLILDNLEQIAPGATEIDAFLDAVPDTTVIATSRAPLRLREEQEYPVLPLDVPRDEGDSLDEVLRHAAVRQFIDRARAARPGFEPRPEDAPYLARIVSAVGGLPLAVELVAARVRSLSLPQIAQRLGNQLTLLRGGPRDLPERQRALRDTLRWSYELLEPEAGALLAVLAVFPGGATLEALEVVAGDVLAHGALLDALDPLVEHSLLMRSVDSTNRYRTLQVVREFAGELLQGSGRADEVWRAHAEWLRDLVSDVEPMLLSAKQAEGLDRLREEYDNLRAVLDWATATDPALGALLAAPLWRYWQMRGRLAEGRRILDRLLERLPPETDAATRAALLSARGGVTYWQRDIPVLTESYQEAAELYEELGDTPRLAHALYNRAFPLFLQARFEEALEFAGASERLYAGLGDTAGVARTQWALGILFMYLGDLDRAGQLLADSTARLRVGDDTYHLGWALRMLGRNFLLQRRPQEARQALDEGLRLFAVTDLSAIILFLTDYASLAALEGSPERQLRLVGAIRRIQRATGTDLVEARINQVVGLEDSLAALGARADALVAEGAAMSDEEAVRYALDR